mmetsp:Transcript_31799/g.53813  ORF Transcript_31799/g.53813 Transcript_31799/m.53813 type:complete len:515 (-) Transcript_31799:2307-3851(-)
MDAVFGGEEFQDQGNAKVRHKKIRQQQLRVALADRFLECGERLDVKDVDLAPRRAMRLDQLFDIRGGGNAKSLLRRRNCGYQVAPLRVGVRHDLLTRRVVLPLELERVVVVSPALAQRARGEELAVRDVHVLEPEHDVEVGKELRNVRLVLPMVVWPGAQDVVDGIQNRVAAYVAELGYKTGHALILLESLLLFPREDGAFREDLLCREVVDDLATRDGQLRVDHLERLALPHELIDVNTVWFLACVAADEFAQIGGEVGRLHSYHSVGKRRNRAHHHDARGLHRTRLLVGCDFKREASGHEVLRDVPKAEKDVHLAGVCDRAIPYVLPLLRWSKGRHKLEGSSLEVTVSHHFVDALRHQRVLLHPRSEFCVIAARGGLTFLRFGDGYGASESLFYEGYREQRYVLNDARLHLRPLAELIAPANGLDRSDARLASFRYLEEVDGDKRRLVDGRSSELVHALLALQLVAEREKIVLRRVFSIKVQGRGRGGAADILNGNLRRTRINSLDLLSHAI